MGGIDQQQSDGFVGRGKWGKLPYPKQSMHANIKADIKCRRGHRQL